MWNQVFKPNSVADYAGAIFVMIAFFVGVVGFWYITSRAPSKFIPPSERPVVSCASNFLAYQETKEKIGQTVSLIPERQSMFVENGEFINSKIVIAKSETVESKVACGYLFVRAGTIEDGTIQTWEDVIINPSGFGGHLISDSAVSVNDGKEYSEYVYNLNRIQYWPTHARQSINTADWASLLNVQPTVPFTIALNTERKGGFVDEVSIVYKCWNPKTGEENKLCKLSVESKVDSTTSEIK